MKLAACCSDGLYLIFQSGSWYKFNDEDIVKMQGKLRLSQDEDAAGRFKLVQQVMPFSFPLANFPSYFRTSHQKVIDFLSFSKLLTKLLLRYCNLQLPLPTSSIYAIFCCSSFILFWMYTCTCIAFLYSFTE